jgi:hypothetical protein
MQWSMLLLLLLQLLDLPTVDVSSVQGEHACRASRQASSNAAQ